MEGHTMANKQTIRYRTFHALGPPLSLPTKGEVFFPWQKRAATRDSTNGPIGEHLKKRMALDPDRLKIVLAAMQDVGRRITALEAARAAPQPTQDAPCACHGTLVTQPDGGAVLLGEDGQTFMSPTHRNPKGQPDTFNILPTRDAKDKQMTRHPGLAPLNHVRDNLTFADRLRKSFADTTANGATYGESPSRFDSREQARLASYMPGESLPSPAELNAAHRSFHAGVGASGQAHDNVTSPGGEGGQSGVNRRGSLHMAVASDNSERFIGHGPHGQFQGRPDVDFANELDQLASGATPQQALNAYYGALSRAKTAQARDAIDRVWQAYTRTHDMRPSFKPLQDASPWSGVYEANKSTIGGNPNLIQPGQQLNVGGGQTHTVQSGETLSGISQQYGNPKTVESGTSGSGSTFEAPSHMQSPTGGALQAAASQSGWHAPMSIGTQASDLPAQSGGSSGTPHAPMSSAENPAPLPPDKPAGLQQNTGSGGISAPSGNAPGTISAEAQSKPVGEGSTESFLKSQGVGTNE
jgi:hypothetical protein